MSALLTPDERQIERELDRLLDGKSGARVLGLRSPTRRAWPEYMDRRQVRFRLAWCESELEARELLDETPMGPTSGLVLLTPLEDSDLADDVRARLHRARLARTDRWVVLRAQFQAREIDSRLAAEPWIVDLLIGHPAPPGGYPPQPGGLIDLETVWTAMRQQLLGLPRGRADLDALYQWAIEGRGPARLADLAPEVKAKITERLTMDAGEGARLLLGAAAGGRGRETLAIGLACGVVFADPPTAASREAAVRLEPRVGGGRLSAAEGQALAEAARRILNRLSVEQPDLASEVEARAGDLLDELHIRDAAGVSPALSLGLEMRLVRAAEAAARAVETGRADDLQTAWSLADVARAHDRAKDHEARVGRVRMAARLACGLLAPPVAERGDFEQLAAAYRDHGCFVDLARKVLRAGDPSAEAAAAYARLCNAAGERRELENQVFAAALPAWPRTIASLGRGVVPLESLLDTVVAPIARERPVLLLVLDGVSLTAWRELADTLSRRGWSELRRAEGPPVLTAAAVLPTVTEVSRASLFCGRLARGQQSIEREGFSEHVALRASSVAGRPPILFHKADLGAGPELGEEVAGKVADPDQRVVALVHNAIDAQLSGSDQIDLSWSSDSLHQLLSLLRLARDAGRVVVVTGDHGHVLENGTRLLPDGVGDRWRSGADAGPGEIVISGASVLAPNGDRAVVAAWSEKVRYGGRRAGYHGGASPQEVLVPLAVLGEDGLLRDWRLAPPAEPSWWGGPQGLAADRIRGLEPQTPARGRAERVPDTRQPDFFASAPETVAPAAPRTGGEPPWLQALLECPGWATQRSLAGKGLPSDMQMRELITALAASNGRCSRALLARALGQPLVRIGGLVGAARRLLNLDQEQVLGADGEDVVLNERLLIQQFELGGGR